MRKILAVVFLLIGGFCGAANSSEATLPIPIEIDGGPSALIAWLDTNRPSFPNDHQRVALDKEKEFLVVYHGRGSMAIYVDAFVFGCTPSNCSLVSLIRPLEGSAKSKDEPKAYFDKRASELVLVSGNGVKRLRVSTDRWSGR